MGRSVMSFIALLWAIGLSIASLILPPLGIIDSSVLILLAQIIVFIASLVGIALPAIFKQTFKHGSDNQQVLSR